MSPTNIFSLGVSLMKNLLIKNIFALRATSLFILLSISFSIIPLAAHAQTEQPPSRQLVIKEKTLGESPRLALVIGNSKYESIGSLKNSLADAVDMASALRAVGFEVLEGEDQNKKQMEDLIREFGDKLYRQKGIGVFFYAGHGVQSNGKNYLVPIDADIPREDDIEYEAVDLGRLLKKFDTAKNELNVIILDACRNNPFAKEWSSYRDVNADEGLAKIGAPKGTVMFYSTEPGKTASDGSGRNGLFTEILLENIKKPNLEFDALTKTVTRGVAAKSKQSQIPYKEGTSFSDFYFAGNTAEAKPDLNLPVAKTSEAEPEIKAKDASTVEKETWDIVRNSNNPQDFRDYLADSPNGTFASQAKIKLEQLVWNSIRTTNDKIKVQNYLKEFPDGVSIPTAKAKLRQLEARENVELAKTETAKVEPTVTENTNTETAKVETEESALPVKKTIVSKVETPKAATRTVKTKVKPSVSESGKYPVRTNSFGMELVQLPAGSFMMGASEADVNSTYALGRKEDAEIERGVFDNEKPQNRITFANDFWIGRTEVTQGQWTAVMGKNQSLFADCGADCPVERVSWEDAKEFIAKLNEQKDGFEYRLPSEAEWEYAARGGKSGSFPFAAARIGDFAWYNANSGEEGLNTKPRPVGKLLPNAFGLYDMFGNVAEWCEDTYAENYENIPADGTADTNSNPKVRIIRGGFFNDLSYLQRVTRRKKLETHIRRSENGLRIVAVEKE